MDENWWASSVSIRNWWISSSMADKAIILNALAVATKLLAKEPLALFT